MSTTIRSYGFMALLINPFPEDQLEELYESLWNSKSILDINYEGTLVYSDNTKFVDYDERENIYGLILGNNISSKSIDDFIKLTNDAGLFVDKFSIQSYNCIWYNGGDSDMSLLCKEEFLKI